MKFFVVVFLMNVLFNKGQISPHVIPEEIEAEVKVALSHYPELANTPIEFKFKSNIKKSTMQARPKVSSFFKSKREREYLVVISEKFKISGSEFLTEDLPRDVMIGWLGHELGHIMDYRNRGRFNMVGFGLKYLLMDNHIMKAERAADSYAIESGMEKYILKAKRFILNHADIDEKYLARIKKYYLSPEEIMEIVRLREEELEVESAL